MLNPLRWQACTEWKRASLILKAAKLRDAIKAIEDVHRTDATQCRTRLQIRDKQAEMADQVMPMLRSRIVQGHKLPEVVVGPPETRKRGAPSTEPEVSDLHHILELTLKLKPELVKELTEYMRPELTKYMRRQAAVLLSV